MADLADLVVKCEAGVVRFARNTHSDPAEHLTAQQQSSAKPSMAHGNDLGIVA
jgi:hypothetical protein